MLPELHVSGLSLRSYPLVVTAGIILAWGLLVVRCARLGYAPARVLAWVVLAYPVGALSARLLALAVSIARGHGAGGGFSVLGAVVGCVLFSVAYTRIVFGETPWRLLDAVSFSFPLTLGIGRIGCLLNGCCTGVRAETLFVPFTLPLGWLAPGTEGALAHAGEPASGAYWNLPLLLSLHSLVVLIVLEVLWRRRAQLRLRDGDLLASWLVLDALGRVPLELLRADPAGSSAPWQALSFALGLAGALALGVRRLVRRPTESAPREAPRGG